MTNANMADGTVIAYSYDALGNRRAKTVNGETTNYLTAPIFGMSHVLAELAPDMTIKSSYIYAGPQLLKEEPSTTDRSLDLYMLHEGKVGSITHTVDMNGSVRNEYDYDTFGTRTNVKTANTGSNQHFGYTGEMFDAESGLLYLRARYYDPSIGRFISADPYLGRLAQPVTQNRYIYVHNNPLLFVDPLGNAAAIFNLCLSGGMGIGGTGCTKAGIVANFDFDWNADNFGLEVDGFVLNEAGGGLVSGPAVSATATFEINTATSVAQLNGLSSQVGATLNPLGGVVPVILDGGAVIAQNYSGIYLGGGIGSGVPFTSYSYITNTFDALPNETGSCPEW